MVLKSLKISNFRNYDNAFLNLSPNVNVIYGDNGEGKTNLLESIYYLAITKSHRSFIDDYLINKKSDYFKLKGVFFRDSLPENYEIIYSVKKKQLLIDNNEIKKVSDFVSRINIIIFYPEDLDLIKGSPIERRRYLNIQLSQLSKKYIKILNEYDKLLKQRNDMLKKLLKNEKIDELLFEIITTSMIEKAAKIYIYRKNYIDSINLNCAKIYKDIANIDDFYVKYENNLDIDEYKEENIVQKLKNKLNEYYEIEIKRGVTLFGPHKDDFYFYVDDSDLKSFGSQGQQRMAVLALKLAEIPIFKTVTSYYPILLLDDVFSELDITKKNNLLKYITGNIQTIITTTDLSDIDSEILKIANLIKIKEGNIIEEVDHGKEL